MGLESYSIYGILAIGVGGALAVWFWIIPKLAEKEYLKFGLLDRSEIFSMMKSDNRLANMLRTGSLWIVAIGFGIVLVLMFLIDVLTEAPIPRVMTQIVLIVGIICGTSIGSFAIQIHNWGRKFHPVTHHISVSPDGIKTIDKDLVITSYEEIGEFDKASRADYINQLNIQFCPHYKKKLDGEWSLDTTKDWASFCVEHCTKEKGFCNFYYLRLKLISLKYWRLYEARIKQFGIFPMAVYIMDDSWSRTFPRFEKQFAVRGVIINCSASDINTVLVDINHTIDTGKHGEDKPRKVLCPIFWVTDSASLRRRRFEAITPQHMQQETLQKIFLERPVPGSLKAIDYVRDIDTKYLSAMETKVAGKKQAYEWAYNVFTNMLRAGRVIKPYKENKWFWIFLACIILAGTLIIIYLSQTMGTGVTNGVTNSTNPGGFL